MVSHGASTGSWQDTAVTALERCHHLSYAVGHRRRHSGSFWGTTERRTTAPPGQTWSRAHVRVESVLDNGSGGSGSDRVGGEPRCRTHLGILTDVCDLELGNHLTIIKIHG